MEYVASLLLELVFGDQSRSAKSDQILQAFCRATFLNSYIRRAGAARPDGSVYVKFVLTGVAQRSYFTSLKCLYPLRIVKRHPLPEELVCKYFLAL